MSWDLESLNRLFAEQRERFSAHPTARECVEEFAPELGEYREPVLRSVLVTALQGSRLEPSHEAVVPVLSAFFWGIAVGREFERVAQLERAAAS